MAELSRTLTFLKRSNAVPSYDGTFNYYILLYAQLAESMNTGQHKVRVVMTLACDADSTFGNYNTTASATVDGKSVFSWVKKPIPSSGNWPSYTITAGNYPRWIDIADGYVYVDVGFGVTKDVTISASWQRDDLGITPPPWLASVTPANVSVTVTLPAIIPEAEAKPVVSMTLKPVSSLAETFDGMYIQNLTKVDAELSAESNYGATIDSLQMVIGNAVYGAPYTSGYLTQTGNVAVIGKATDSNGLVGTAEQTINVIPYSKPGITNVVCERCDEQGSPTDSGTYLKIIAKRIYSSVEGKNSCVIRYRVNGGSWNTILEGSASGDEVDTIISGVVTSTTSSYTIEVGVKDTIGNEASVTKIVPTDYVEFHLREGGKGVAFGGYATKEGFTCYMDAEFRGKVGGVIADYVVGQGTDGGWRWRKWASGIAECWGTQVVPQEVSVTDSWGPLYSSKELYFNYPSSLFTAKPTHVSLELTATNGKDFWLARTGNGTAMRTNSVFLITATAGQVLPANTIAISAHALGNWKE